MFMRRRPFVLAPLMFLFLIFGISLLFGRARSADAYEAGFAAGQQAALSEQAPDGTAASSAAAPAKAPVYGSWHGFSFFGGLLKLFFFVVLFGWLFRLFGFWRWRRWGGRPWGHHHAGPGGECHHGPWVAKQSGSEPREKGPQDIDPGQSYV